MNKFDVFINKNSGGKLAQYTVSKQKEVARLVEKYIFKIVTCDNTSSNAHVFNSYFVDKIKNPSTDKA